MGIKHPMAQWVNNLKINGFTDWYIPSKDELNQLYNNIPDLFKKAWYWSSTALGFGGLGGQAFTDAYTIVLRSALDGSYCVYFGGRFAYRVNRPNELFFEDVKRMRMEEVKTVVELKKYEDDCHAN